MYLCVFRMCYELMYDIINIIKSILMLRELMTSQDIVMVLVYTFPMFFFTVYPGIKLGDYLEEKYQLEEDKKRVVVVSVTFLSALVLALFLQFA